MDIPVVFIIYNRPDKTRLSFEAIRFVRPSVLYLIADGPKNEADVKLVAETRWIAEQVDWDCRVEKIYASENLNCGVRISSGLDEVFRHCEMAVIIEDDIVATPSFFTFCSEMLARYEKDPRVMAVTGWNGLVAYQSEAYSAFFSKYSGIWGWGTWRRAWEKYKFEPEWTLPDFEKQMALYFPDEFRRKLHAHMYRHRTWARYQTWDLQWALAIYFNQGMVVTSTVNLCQNIGFDVTGTHLTNFNIRGLYPVFDTQRDELAGEMNETYGVNNDWYDRSALLLSLFSMYQDIRHLLLVFRNPQLLPENENRAGWECTLQPFQEPELCLEILDHLGAYISHPDLDRFRTVFQKLSLAKINE